jgi:7-cyano-7-deazaguanine tRNA-ribosyltransferase
LYVTLAEISRIRQAITDGTLWELVDERCRSHPQLLAAYRGMLSYAEEFEPHDRVTKRRFFYRGDESCRRTDVIRYQQQISRFRPGNRALVTIGCKTVNGFDTVFSFKPPFGPYPPELCETYPVGQSEIPVWDETMVRQGCIGIRVLAESHPESRISIRCKRLWFSIVQGELPGLEVICDED